jgi:hypothetical protein
MANDITLKTQEQKVLSFTFKDASGTIINLTGATFSLVVKDSGGTAVITKTDTDFDKTLVVSGIVKVTLTSTNLNQAAGSYNLELKTIFTTGEIDKSTTFSLNLIQALTK